MLTTKANQAKTLVKSGTKRLFSSSSTPPTTSSPNLIFHKSSSTPLLRKRRDEYGALLGSSKYAQLPGGRKPKNFVDICLSIFDLAAENPFPFTVLGPSPQVWTPSLMRNLRITSYSNDIEKGLRMAKKNPLHMNPDIVQLPEELIAAEALALEAQGASVGELSGAVLFEYFYWSLQANDAFVLGALAAGKEIHLAMHDCRISDIDGNFLYDVTESRPRVLGRELPLLVNCNYTRIENPYPDTGLVLLQDPENLTQNQDLVTLFEGMQQTKSLADVRASIAPLESGQ